MNDKRNVLSFSQMIGVYSLANVPSSLTLPKVMIRWDSIEMNDHFLTRTASARRDSCLSVHCKGSDECKFMVHLNEQETTKKASYLLVKFSLFNNDIIRFKSKHFIATDHVPSLLILCILQMCLLKQII